MDQVTALQQEIQQKHDELKSLYEQLGYAKSSIRNLVALAKNAGHADYAPVKTAESFLAGMSAS